MRGPAGKAQRDTGECSYDDAEQNGAAHPASHEDGDQKKADGGKNDLGVCSPPQSNEGSRIGDDDFGIAQPDECDEKTDASGGAVFQAIGNVVDDVLADL